MSITFHYEKIQDLHKRKIATIDKLAKAAKVSPPTVRSWLESNEDKRKEPKIKDLINLCDKLNLDFFGFFTEENNSENNLSNDHQPSAIMAASDLGNKEHLDFSIKLEQQISELKISYQKKLHEMDKTYMEELRDRMIKYEVRIKELEMKLLFLRKKDFDDSSSVSD